MRMVTIALSLVDAYLLNNVHVLLHYCLRIYMYILIIPVDRMHPVPFFILLVFRISGKVKLLS